MSRRIGSWLIALTLAGSFVFGVVNRFVLASPDHVSHVAAAWRPLFATTAVVLALLEAAGSGPAFNVALKFRHAILTKLVAWHACRPAK